MTLLTAMPAPVRLTSTDPYGILRALRDLGDSPDAVAQSLFERGVRGEPAAIGACPITVYLRSFTAEPVRTMASYVLIGDVWAAGGWIGLPHPVAQFVDRFDLGEYAELDVSWNGEPVPDDASSLALVPA